MKKNQIATILLILLLVCAALTACNHTHGFEWHYDDDMHWRECRCGEQNSRERHLFTTDYRYDEEYHFTVCICGNENNKELHSFDKIMYDDTYHWKECKCHVRIDRQKHNFDSKWKTDNFFHWKECECGQVNYKKPHVFSESVEKNPTCSEKGVLKLVCIDCGETIYQSIEEIPHIYSDDNECLICGAHKPYYTMSEDGRYIYFGEYPQSNVTNVKLINDLNTKYDRLPANGNPGMWTSYGYDSIDNSDYMWYIDVEFAGAKYRGVYFTQYRPSYVKTESSTDNTSQDDNGYLTSQVYWFKFEPIKWRVLTLIDNSALIMSDMILDSQAFQEQYYIKDGLKYTDFGNAPEGTFANNYKYSSIRAWLNDDFYNGAFDDDERDNICLTTVDNSMSTTGLNNPDFICEDTEDYIFLLSFADCVNVSYGFSYIYREHISRQLKPTAYSMSQGAYVSTAEDSLGNGWWLTRSPRNISELVCGIYPAGRVDSDYRFDLSSCGVVPVLVINL